MDAFTHVVNYEDKHKRTDILARLIDKWKPELGLSDWIIMATLNSPDEMVLKDVGGECEYLSSMKTAIIRILDEPYYGDRLLPYDMEKTVVHELLHCKFGILDCIDNPMVDAVLHQMIEDMARLLVKANRGLVIQI